MTTAQQQSPLFIYYPHKDKADTLYQNLLALDASASNFTDEFKAACESFKQTANYLADKAAISKTADFDTAERIFNGSTSKNVIAEYLQNLSLAKTAKTANTTPTNTSILWDNIFLQLVEGNEDSTMASNLTKALKMVHLAHLIFNG